MDQKSIMELGVDQAHRTMTQKIGGPFGAVIVNKDGEVISVASNTVLRDHDPSAHAEVNAIRIACRKLHTHDLSGCELYTTAQPCPMCLSATIWANIRKIHYGCTAEDAEEIGFRDKYIYDFIEGQCKDESVVEMDIVERDKCLELFKEYHKNNLEMY